MNSGAQEWIYSLSLNLASQYLSQPQLTSLLKSLPNLEKESFLGLWICVFRGVTQQHQNGGDEGYNYPSLQN